MSIPSVTEFEEIAQEFNEYWNFPNAIGCIDGKHIRIRAPADSGSLFYNYKKYFSIVLQGVVDAKYRFQFIDIGGYGKQNDCGTLYESTFYKFLQNDDNFPPDQLIAEINSETSMPYLYLADDAYPLRKRIMKPYGHKKLTAAQRIFNGRLSRGRRCVECTFGIIANKWRILLKSIETKPEKSDIIVKAICILHNIIIDCEGIDMNLLEKVDKLLDTQGDKLIGIGKSRKNNRAAKTPMNLRDDLKNYFNGCGSVPWQQKYLK